MSWINRIEFAWNGILKTCVIALTLTIGIAAWQLAFPKEALAKTSCTANFCIETLACISQGCEICNNQTSHCQIPF